MNGTFTCWGPVRGCCNHLHNSTETAKKCLKQDQENCQAQGGYSDRHLRAVQCRDQLRTYDVLQGPGERINEQI